MANAFASFFSSVYVASTHVSAPPTNAPECSPPLTFELSEVFSKLQTLPSKASVTPDNFPPIFFRNLSDVLAEPLAILFTRSLAEREVPNAFREALVTPIHKKGARKLLNNYRPVAQLSIMCIVMEKIVVDYLVQFLTISGQLDPEQHGFCKGKSTETQLLEATQDWGLALARKRSTHVVYFDFSKAFDKVDHGLLLNKMLTLGIRESVVEWCGSYLTDRCFSVRVQNSSSPFLSCASGVPQGSVLGPILWSIFILDIKEGLPPAVSYKLYADDLKIYLEVTDDTSCATLQAAVNAVQSWASENGMLISTEKCAVLKTRPHHFTYTLQGDPLPEVLCMRDLGVMISADLRFREHVTHVAKASSVLCNLVLRCFVIQRVEHYVQLYKALVEPKLLYCAPVWSPSLSGDMMILERVRTRYIRLVAYRCGVDREVISRALTPVTELHRRADERAFMRTLRSENRDHFFDVSGNNLRSHYYVRAKAIAPTNIVNNLFSWRVVRKERSFILNKAFLN